MFSLYSPHYVDTTQLLKGLGASSKEQSSNRISARCCSATNKIAPADGMFAFIFDAEYDLLVLSNNYRVVDRPVLQVCEDNTGFVVSPMCD